MHFYDSNILQLQQILVAEHRSTLAALGCNKSLLDEKLQLCFYSQVASKTFFLLILKDPAFLPFVIVDVTVLYTALQACAEHVHQVCAMDVSDLRHQTLQAAGMP